MKSILVGFLMLVGFATAQAASYCDIHPLAEGCPAFCQVYKLEPSCGGNAGENLCHLKPFEKGCPNYCRIHQLDPVCR
jgi:hypothetical protein